MTMLQDLHPYGQRRCPVGHRAYFSYLRLFVHLSVPLSVRPYVRPSQLRPRGTQRVSEGFRGPQGASEPMRASESHVWVMRRPSEGPEGRRPGKALEDLKETLQGFRRQAVRKIAPCPTGHRPLCWIIAHVSIFKRWRTFDKGPSYRNTALIWEVIEDGDRKEEGCFIKNFLLCKEPKSFVTSHKIS